MSQVLYSITLLKAAVKQAFGPDPYIIKHITERLFTYRWLLVIF